MSPVVYRVYDVAGELLYIGSTSEINQRKAIHMADRSSAIAFPMQMCAYRWDLTEYPDMESARAAEREAIKAEAPYLNRQHNPTRWRRVAGKWEPLTELYREFWTPEKTA
jgi:predicted GIY-YIG superfamily endonuclease